MAGAAQPVPSEPQKVSAADRLDSWKEIAGYLKRSVRTLHRWEAEQGLPVHRHLHQSSGTVYAFKPELDTWWASRKIEIEAAEEALHEALPAATQSSSAAAALRRRLFVVAVIMSVAALASIGYWRKRASVNITPIRSLAVLPLENLTGDSGQEYVADSMTDALTTELARGRLVQVTSRTSAAQYKGARQPLRTIARNLGVDAVVEGTVSRNGQRMEINVQLIQVSSDQHLWAERYERDFSALAALPGEIAWDIVRAVPADTRPGAPRQMATRPANASAYEAYVKGRYFWSKGDRENLVKALKYFDEAIAADPSYAPAYSGLSDTYRMSTNVLGPPREWMPKAGAAARKALDMDDTLAEAHASLAGVLSRYDFDWKGAEREFKRALELEPEYAEAHRAYGIYLVALQRNQEAFEQLQRAAWLNPLSPVINADFAIALRNLHRFDESIEQVKKVQEIDPNSALAELLLAEDFRRKGDSDRALAAFERAEALSTKNPIPWVGYGYGVLGRKSKAKAILAALEKESTKRYISPQGFAIVHMGLGNKEETLTYLEKAYEERSFISPGMTEERWGILRSEPRFQNILRRMGLPLGEMPGNGKTQRFP